MFFFNIGSAVAVDQQINLVLPFKYISETESETTQSEPNCP